MGGGGFIGGLTRGALAAASFGTSEIGGSKSIGARAQKQIEKGVGHITGEYQMTEALKDMTAQQAALAEQEAAAQQKAIDDAKAERQAAKDRAAESIRSSIAGMTKTNYTTALGAAGSRIEKKKTLLGG